MRPEYFIWKTKKGGTQIFLMFDKEVNDKARLG